MPVFSTAFSLPIELLGADKYNLATDLISSKPPSSTNNSFLLSSSILVSKAEYFFQLYF